MRCHSVLSPASNSKPIIRGSSCPIRRRHDQFRWRVAAVAARGSAAESAGTILVLLSGWPGAGSVLNTRSGHGFPAGLLACARLRRFERSRAIAKEPVVRSAGRARRTRQTACRQEHAQPAITLQFSHYLQQQRSLFKIKLSYQLLINLFI